MQVTTTQQVDMLAVLIQSQPGMAERLLAEHTDDESGHCRSCSNGGQTGHYRWPCTIYRCAARSAAEGLQGELR